VIEEQTTKGGLDFGAFRKAIGGKDPEALLAFYSEDADFQIVNAALPDGAAFELKGGTQIERYLRAVCDQEMSCLIEDETVLGEGSVSFGQVCEYADGTRVSVRTTLEVTESLIGRQTDVVERARRNDVRGMSAEVS
jgi:ketosteroid isomerase-like protein